MRDEITHLAPGPVFIMYERVYPRDAWCPFFAREVGRRLVFISGWPWCVRGAGRAGLGSSAAQRRPGSRAPWAPRLVRRLSVWICFRQASHGGQLRRRRSRTERRGTCSTAHLSSPLRGSVCRLDRVHGSRACRILMIICSFSLCSSCLKRSTLKAVWHQSNFRSVQTGLF